MALMALHIPLLALCVLVAMQAGVAVAIPLVAGLLACVCATALGMVARGSWRTACHLVFSLACILVESWLVFLPVAGADMAFFAACGKRKPHDARRRPGRMLVAAVPLICAGIGVVSRPQPGFMAWTVCVFTLLSSLTGYLLGVARTQSNHWRALADGQRERLRLSHMRLDNMRTGRGEDLRRARMEERVRIAREIHDNVGHTLTSAIMMVQANQVVAAAQGDTERAESFARVGVTLDEAMTTIRRSVHDLRDEGTDFTAMVEDAVASAQPLAVQLHNGIRHIPAPAAHAFTAIIRETLANAARHGHAHHATVKLNDLPGLWQLIVQDDGGHSENNGHGKHAGMGLLDIEERARALGGTSSYGPYGPGWRVFVSIPKPQDMTAERKAIQQ